MKMENIKPASLVDICINTAIDNRRYLGDVGDVELNLLEKILPHCSKEQLAHIEKSTKGRDLSPITDKLWKRFFEMEFGIKAADEVIEKMKRKKVTFKWLALYQAKLKEVEEAENNVGERLKQLYQKEVALKQSRQVQVCNKVPPSSRKRRILGGEIKPINKVRKEYMNCLEVRNIQAMKVKKTAAKCNSLMKRIL